ncbi:MAG TPA: hypothetical protein VJ180_15740 [Pyrinomonadaceae bacterium]|nr:hypothetical protein [Pyrinomonadaceae bacterium]
MTQIRLRLDPWPADYESSFQIEELKEEADAKIDTEVEGIGWQAVEPGGDYGRPERIYFVDGVRRIEARIIVDDDSGHIIRGLFGSIGFGAVRVELNTATFEEMTTRRYLVVGSCISPEQEHIKIGDNNVLFEPCSVPESGPIAPISGLQNLMRTEEAALAERLAKESSCVFADGPLTYFSGVKQTAVGVIKRLIEPYLSATHFNLVRVLRTGQRTPLFVITKGKYDRYSWYLRVGNPRVMDHDMAGVLRLEVRSGLGLAGAVELANMSASCIPAFVGEWFRDPRSPQNLLPIGSLEQELRHRLGDALAIRRAIEVKLFSVS